MKTIRPALLVLLGLSTLSPLPADARGPAASSKVIRLAEAAHRNITFLVAERFGFSRSDATQMSAASNLPDVVDARYKVQQFLHSGIRLVWGKKGKESGISLGLAPRMCRKFYVKAKSHWEKGEMGKGIECVGEALHYLQDMYSLHTFAVPLDPRRIIQITKDQLAYHAGIEDYMSRNWEGGHCFRKEAEKAIAKTSRPGYKWQAVGNPLTFAQRTAKEAGDEYLPLVNAYKMSLRGKGDRALKKEITKIVRASAVNSATLLKSLLDYRSAGAVQ